MIQLLLKYLAKAQKNI